MTPECHHRGDIDGHRRVGFSNGTEFATGKESTAHSLEVINERDSSMGQNLADNFLAAQDKNHEAPEEHED